MKMIVDVGQEESRVPLGVSRAFERMNLPMSGMTLNLTDVKVPGTLLEDYRPVCESLEWRIAQARWENAGVLPFVESEVPFLINNNGRLSADVALVLFTLCMEVEALPAQIAVLEAGAGTGLFARYFLDSFRDLCTEHDKDFYWRLTYVATDNSPRTVAQWKERGLFDAHADRVTTLSLNPVKDELPALPGSLLAVICNYVLDVMPCQVIKKGASGAEQLMVRTLLNDDQGTVAQYTRQSPAEIAQEAASAEREELLKLAPLMPLFEYETAFRPLPTGDLPFAEEALALAKDGAKTLLNYGALQATERFFNQLATGGVLIVNDYGPVAAGEVESFCNLQRFGSTVAFGLNFPFLELFCGERGFKVSKPENDEKMNIHMRLFSRSDLPRTRDIATRAFSLEASDYYTKPIEEARAHVSAGRMQEATASYRAALERNSRNWHLMAEAGEFLSLQLRNFDAAVELLREAVLLNPCYSAWLWNALGDCLYCLDRFGDAHEAYLQAARIDPGDSRTNLNLAYTLTHDGNTGEALRAIAAGLANDPREAFRARLLEKQRQILTGISARSQAEYERLARRAARFQNA